MLIFEELGYFCGCLVQKGRADMFTCRRVAVPGCYKKQ
jgi:hypothetical protein